MAVESLDPNNIIDNGNQAQTTQSSASPVGDNGQQGHGQPQQPAQTFGSARSIMNNFGSGLFAAGSETSPTIRAMSDILAQTPPQNGLSFVCTTVNRSTYNMHYSIGCVVMHGQVDGVYEAYIYPIILEGTNIRPERIEPSRGNNSYYGAPEFTIVPSPMDAWNKSTYKTVSTAVLRDLGIAHNARVIPIPPTTLFRDADDGTETRARMVLSMAWNSIRSRFNEEHPSQAVKFDVTQLGNEGSIRRANFRYSDSGGVYEDVFGSIQRADYMVDLVVDESGQNNNTDYQNKASVVLGSAGGFYDIRPLPDENNEPEWVAHHIHTVLTGANQIELSPEIAMTLLMTSMLADSDHGFINFLLHRHPAQSQIGDYGYIMEDYDNKPVLFDTSPQGIEDTWDVLREDISPNVVQIIRCPKAGGISYLTDMFVSIVNNAGKKDHALHVLRYKNMMDSLTGGRFSNLVHPDDPLFVFNLEVSVGRYRTAGTDGAPSEVRPLCDMDTLYAAHLCEQDQGQFWAYADTFVILDNIDPNQVLDRRRAIQGEMARGTNTDDGVATDVIMTPGNWKAAHQAFEEAGLNVQVENVPIPVSNGMFGNRPGTANTMAYAAAAQGRSQLSRKTGNNNSPSYGGARYNPVY